MKKTKLLISIFIITLMIIFPIITKASNYQINTNDYKSGGPSESDVKEMYRVGGRVAGVLQVIGTIVSFGSLIIIGIRYVIASVEEKAELKERLMPYIVGAIFLFGATNVVGIIYNVIRYL